jgi:hypothetical protein
MLAAIYGGLLEAGPMQPLAPLCSTGDCTFPIFTSLGFWSECCDVTAETIQTFNINGVDLTCDYTLRGNVVAQSNNFRPYNLRKIFVGQITRYHLPDRCNLEALGNSVASFGGSRSSSHTRHTRSLCHSVRLVSLYSNSQRQRYRGQAICFRPYDLAKQY